MFSRFRKYPIFDGQRSHNITGRMGISERKAREKEELRGKIITAALDMYIAEGYDHVSIRKIADVVEYSPATIYLYFQSKDELMFFVQQEAFSRFFEFLAPALSIKDPVEQLRGLGRKYMEFGMANPQLYDLMFILQSPMKVVEIENKGWECGFETFQLLEVVVQNCQNAGYFPGRDSHEVALQNWGLVHGLMSLYLKERLIMISAEQQLALMDQVLETHFQHLLATHI